MEQQRKKRYQRSCSLTKLATCVSCTPIQYRGKQSWE